jgi:hypothetical protein
VVRVHPVTGRRVLYVNRQFCTRIKDLKADESDALLEFLYRQATIPSTSSREVAPNTLVMWDNRSVQHYASHDYYPARRTMERVTVKGDKPQGVTGAYTQDTVPADGTVKPPSPKARGPARSAPSIATEMRLAALLVRRRRAAGGARREAWPNQPFQDRRALSAPRRPDRRAGPG